MENKPKKKLIRDKIHEIYKLHDIHIAEDEEYKQELTKKLQEEINEFKENDSPEELADIIEVIYSIAKFKNMSIDELEKIRIDKADKRGSFDKRVILKKNFQ
ncbi:phosphoribosyl-ATP pyrophosphohydrolase [Nanoarchaeota archaeon]